MLFCWPSFSHFPSSQQFVRSLAFFCVKNLVCVKFLKVNGVDLKAVDQEGTTTLHVAAEEGNVLTLDYLVNKIKMNPAIKDVAGDTAFHAAAHK